MDVITFGATSSPVSAQFVKNKNALEFVDRCPRAVEGILKSHYVDDYLDSFETVGEAKSVSSEVRAIHLKGGFELHNWSSNNKEVLENLEVAATKAEKHLTSNRDTNTERILGMLWNPEEDKLAWIFNEVQRRDCDADRKRFKTNQATDIEMRDEFV